MGDWRQVRLGDVAADVTVGFVGQMADQYVSEGVPFLRSLNVRPHRLDLTDVKQVSPSFHQRLAKSTLRPGDVVTVRTGKPGQTAVIPDWLPEANCSDLVITRPGPDLDSRWLSYQLNWLTGSRIAGQLVGAVQQHFNVRSAEALILALPPIEEQRAIGRVLGAMDDKIAANDRIASTASALAEARFLDAVSGATESATIGELATTVLGGTPSRVRADYWTDGSVPWIASGKANENRVLEPSEWITTDALERSAAKLMPRGATILAITGATLGQIARLEIETSGNQSLVGIWQDDPGLNDWIYFAIRQQIGELLKHATGAAQQHVNKGAVDALKIPLPPSGVMPKWANAVRPLLDLCAATDRESIKLATTRDSLLSPLMSGRVRVREADWAVEGVD